MKINKKKIERRNKQTEDEMENERRLHTRIPFLFIESNEKKIYKNNMWIASVSKKNERVVLLIEINKHELKTA